MLAKYLKSLFLTSLFILNLSIADEFSDGPYGTLYFDTAEGFNIPDLSSSLQGDVNLDENINIQAPE